MPLLELDAPESGKGAPG